MAGIKISELPEASSICGNELVPIVQGSCTKFVSASAIGSTGADNITSITAGCGLVGGGCSGSINIAIDSNCFAQFNGTTTTMEAFSGNWESAYSTVEGLSSNWDQSACAGLNCVGDITGLCVGSGLVGGGESGTVNVCIDAVCSVAWNGTTSIVAANSATWGSGGGGGITGFDAGGDGITIDDSDTTSVVVEVDSTVARTNSVDERFNGNLTIGGNLSSVGNILSGGVNIDQLFGSGGGGTTITGTATKIAKFNSAGNNVEDSSITDSGTLVCVESNTEIIGNVATGGENDPHTIDAAVTNVAIVGGADGTITSGGEYSAIIGGESNKTCSGCSTTIGGMLNETIASYSSVLGGTLNKTCGSGIQSAVVGGCTNIAKHASSVIAGGTDMTTVSADMLHTNSLYIKDLPETDPGVEGVVYQSDGEVKVSSEAVTVADVAGTSSTFGSSILYFSSDSVTYGPVAASVSGNYYKPTMASTDELSVAFYSDAAEVEIKIERSQSSIQVFIDDKPVHEYAVAGYQNRLLKLSHSEAKVRKYELRGKSYGFGGVYTNTSVNDYQVWPYETRKERPLLMIMTDSYGTAFNTTFGISFAEKLAEYLDMDLFSDSLNSSGWSSTGSSSTSTRSASQIALTRDPAVILACLGYNDKSSPNQTNIEAGINGWHSTVTGTFTSANIMLASPWTPVGVDTNLTTVSGYISGRATALGADFIDINGVVTANNKDVYTSGDNTHPTLEGHEYLAQRLAALMLRTGNVPASN